MKRCHLIYINKISLIKNVNPLKFKDIYFSYQKKSPVANSYLPNLKEILFLNILYRNPVKFYDKNQV